MSATSPKRVAVLIENEFDALQVRRLKEIFAIADLEITFLSYLWGYDSLLFTGDDPTCQIDVHQDVIHAFMSDYQGLILIGGYAMDRLRYQVNPVCGGPNKAPAVEFLRRAVTAMERGRLKIGTIGHGLQLFCADPELLRGRQVTCSHNIICDVTNAGGVVMFKGDRAADLHSQGGLITARDNAMVDDFFAWFAADL